MVNLRRRHFIAAPWLAGCAVDPAGSDAVARPGQPLRWRTLQGGFLTPAGLAGLQLPQTPGPGIPLRTGGNGLFVRWIAPGPLALRGGDLLVADTASGRLWRAEALGTGISAIAGAPVGRQTALALGPDGSAWVLDPGARQVLRFGRDGRLLQTQRLSGASPAPRALALADGGATLLLADGLAAQWTELRSLGGLALAVAPEREGGMRISGVDAIAMGRTSVFVLDRLLGVVHQVGRDGRVRGTLGQGELKQPVALAVDRLDRVYVHDAQDACIVRLGGAAPAVRWTAAELGVQQIAGLAVDGLMLAVADGLGGSVVLHSFAHEAAA